MPALNAGITPPGQGDRDTVWNILEQTYYLKEVCDTSRGRRRTRHLRVGRISTRHKTNSSTSSKARWN